ncbi:phage tail sheath family protein [Cryomorphaceae bacterium]|nr:phage tail sheath family protein [Cryomorphaceae bacterium]
MSKSKRIRKSSVTDTIKALPVSGTCFIGYTGRSNAQNRSGIRVRSIALFDTYFSTSRQVPHDHFQLRSSLIQFFEQGGTEALVLSAGSIGGALRRSRTAPLRGTDFLTAWQRLRNSHEARIILAPDSIYLPRADYVSFLRGALDHTSGLPAAFALFELRASSDSLSEMQSLRNALSTLNNFEYGAMYTPNQLGTSGASTPLLGAVAGAVDVHSTSKGMWKGPANLTLNTTQLSEAYDPTALSIFSQSGQRAINPILQIGGNIKIWGARTLSMDPEHKYIASERMARWVEAHIESYLKRFRLHRNAPRLWSRVERSVDGYLNSLFRKGALQGSKASHAYYVKVGLGHTMTAVDVQQGRLIVEVGVAFLKPAEFRVLRMTRKLKT